MTKPGLSRGRILAALADLDDRELARLVEARKEIAGLEKERDETQRRLGKINEKIASLAAGGAVSPVKKKKRGRRPGRPVGSGRGPRGKDAAAKPAKRGEPLPEVAMRILAEAGEPMRVKDLANAALQAGYATRSKDFSRVVRILVYKDPRIVKAGRGLFTVEGAAPSTPAKGAAKKAPKAAAAKGRRRPRKKKAGVKKAGRAKA